MHIGKKHKYRQTTATCLHYHNYNYDDGIHVTVLLKIFSSKFYFTDKWQINYVGLEN